MRYVVMALLIALFAHTANAQEVEAGTGLICDTQAQVEQFIAAANTGIGNAAALQTVNAEAQANACAVLTIAFVKGAKVGSIRTKDGNADIYEILVVGVNVGMGWLQNGSMVQYTLFLTKEEDA